MNIYHYCFGENTFSDSQFRERGGEDLQYSTATETSNASAQTSNYFLKKQGFFQSTQLFLALSAKRKTKGFI